MSKGREADILGFVEKPIRLYESLRGCSVRVDLTVLDECFCKVEDSLDRDFRSFEAPEGYEPSPFKMAGVLCFWLRKLKPFSVPEKTEENRFINETVALLVGFSLVFQYAESEKLHHPKISDTFFHDMVSSLRYNSHSPNGAAFLFEALCL